MDFDLIDPLIEFRGGKLVRVSTLPDWYLDLDEERAAGRLEYKGLLLRGWELLADWNIGQYTVQAWHLGDIAYVLFIDDLDDPPHFRVTCRMAHLKPFVDPYDEGFAVDEDLLVEALADALDWPR
jgi:hypothetical protein